MTTTEIVTLVAIGLAVLLVIAMLALAVRIVPQARAAIVERLGRYHRTLEPGLHVVIPVIDRVRPKMDLREQVVSFPPQPVITQDNLTVNIDTVLYFQVTDPRRATYEIADYIRGVEQLTVTTLRNVVGGLDLERTLTSREEINGALRIVLDEATGKWGLRVNRVELKAIDPPPSIKDSMEKQMRAERDRRAAILNAEGIKQSQILTAEGERQAAVLRADGQREARILMADGEAQAIETVVEAIHRAEPDASVLAYQYLQTLPKIADSASSKVWVVPSEMLRAVEQIGSAFGAPGGRTTPGGDPAAVASAAESAEPPSGPNRWKPRAEARATARAAARDRVAGGTEAALTAGGAGAGAAGAGVPHAAVAGPLVDDVTSSDSAPGSASGHEKTPAAADVVGDDGPKEG
jgi:regulator of protease activity HflC (stomatin/prohibitin superfamily)